MLWGKSWPLFASSVDLWYAVHVISVCGTLFKSNVHCFVYRSWYRLGEIVQVQPVWDHGWMDYQSVAQWQTELTTYYVNKQVSKIVNEWMKRSTQGSCVYKPMMSLMCLKYVLGLGQNWTERKRWRNFPVCQRRPATIFFQSGRTSLHF